MQVTVEKERTLNYSWGKFHIVNVLQFGYMSPAEVSNVDTYISLETQVSTL